MRTPIIFKDKNLVAALVAGLIFLAAGFYSVYVSFDDFRQPIAVHYDIYRGVDYLGTAQDVLDILFIAAGFLVVNFFLAAAVFERERFLSYVLVLSGVLVSLLIFLAVRAIITMNV